MARLDELGKIIEADVLVVGGGAAGCFAAMAVRKKGASVLIVEKLGGIDRSGDSGAGQTDYPAHLNNGEPWDTAEKATEYVSNYDGIQDPKVVRSTYTSRVRETIDQLEKLGAKFVKDPKTGEFHRVQSMGQPGKYYLEFEDKDVKKYIAWGTRKSGAKIIERTMVTKILISGGEVVGALGFNTRDGTFYIFLSKAVIFSTGCTNRLYSNNSTGNPFWSHHGCFNTGSGPALCYDAGAEISGLEFLRGTIQPRGIPTPGMAVSFGHGAYLVNALGERYMPKYDHRGDKAQRFMLCYGTWKEEHEGRGPCYLDYRKLSDEDQDALKMLIPIARTCFKDYLEVKGINLQKDILEIENSVLYTYRGVVINERCETSVKGLYAAGDCSSVVHALAGACTTGLVAGEEAANFAMSNRHSLKDDPESLYEMLCKEKERTFAPLKDESGIRAVRCEDFEKLVQKIMNHYVSWGTNETMLRTALIKLDGLDELREKVVASNFHELRRTHEAFHIHTCAKLLTRSALERKESRAWLYRSDYPKRNDPEWDKFIILKKEGNEMKVSVRPRIPI